LPAFDNRLGCIEKKLKLAGRDLFGVMQLLHFLLDLRDVLLADLATFTMVAIPVITELVVLYFL
jgi:hypothetical protein